ncbi:11831_t:CDS:10, partial [Entrophospora sp. SA101]
QNDDELSFEEDNVLYILENDDEEWWKAKLKINGDEADNGPIGLVPGNYLQEAEHMDTLKALFDYEAKNDDELTFKENDLMYLYERDDDWFLVKLGDSFGYVPNNYVEIKDEQGEQGEQDVNYEEEKENDKRVAKPKFLLNGFSNTSDSTKYVDPLKIYAQQNVHKKSGLSSDVKTWQVTLITKNDKKKEKKKGTIVVGDGKIVYASQSDKAPVQVFNITDIIDIKHEKKHIIIQFGGAKTTTFDFQSNKHSEIFQKIKDCRTSLEIPTVKPPITIRVALYDFKAQGDDEISIREGDKLWIIDDVSSDDWWRCRKGEEEGVVPSSYIKRKALQKPPTPPPALPTRPSARSKTASEEEDVIKKIQTPTNRALPERPAQAQSKSKPIPSNTRTWTDRTGTFKVEAELLNVDDGKVYLHKLNGNKIAVPLDKMSKRDLVYIEEVTGEKLDDNSDDTPLATIAAAHKNKSALTNNNSREQKYSDKIKKNVSFGDTSIIIQDNDDKYSKATKSEEIEKPKHMSEFDRKMQLKHADPYSNLDSIIQREEKKPASQSTSQLFTADNGVLKNNTKKTRPQPTKSASIQVDALSLQTSKDKIEAAFKPSGSVTASSTSMKSKSSIIENTFDDDAWVNNNSSKLFAPTPVKNSATTFQSSNSSLNINPYSQLSPSQSQFNNQFQSSNPSSLSINPYGQQSSSLNQIQQFPNQQQQVTQFDPQNVFASMRKGQIGPGASTNMASTNSSDDKYAIFRQIDPNSQSVFNNTSQNINQQGVGVNNAGFGINNAGFG